jgi:hypothetical protein
MSAALAVGLRAAVRNRPLLFFLGALMIAAFSESAPEDAFVISMLTKGMDARARAPLAIAEDVIGLLAPVFAVAVARRMGVSRFLSLFLIVPALTASALFLDASLWVVVLLCLVLDACAVFWDPIAETHLHQIISSRHRATTTSIVNQLTSLADLAGLGVFALMLGENREALEDATPDLLTAFSGEVEPAAALPPVALGLSLPDLAIVAFVFVGVLAVPLLVLSMRKMETRARESLQPRVLLLRKAWRIRERR